MAATTALSLGAGLSLSYLSSFHLNFERTPLIWTPERTLQPGDTCLAANGNAIHLITIREIDYRSGTIIPAEANIPEIPVSLCYRVKLP